MTILAVYVPKPGAGVLRTIAPKSAIVGDAEPRADGDVRIHFEGNINGASNLEEFYVRTMIAAARHTAEAPTVAVAVVAKADLQLVAYYDADRHVFAEVLDQATLEGWAQEPITKIAGIRLTPGTHKLSGHLELSSQIRQVAKGSGRYFYRTRAGQIMVAAGGGQIEIHDPPGLVQEELERLLRPDQRRYVFGDWATPMEPPASPIRS